jgi:hypothetical protein
MIFNLYKLNNFECNLLIYMVQLRRRIKLISWWNFFYIFGVNNFPILLRGDLNMIRRECETNKKKIKII